MLLIQPAAAPAQPAGKIPRLAIFSLSEPSSLMTEQSENRYYRALFAELRRLGRVEGQTLAVERYGRERNVAGAAALVAEVVRSNPDVVYVVGAGTQFFKAQTATIPIVGLTGDPIAIGLVQSLARPGGNITGVSVDTGPGIHGKRIELLREIFPGLGKLAFITARLVWEAVQGAAMRAAAGAAGVPLAEVLFEFPVSEAVFAAAIEQAVSSGANAIMVADLPDALAHRELIVKRIATTGLPAMYAFTESVEVGGLIAYSFDLAGLNKRVAADIDAILRGVSPGEIPYFQNTKFELSVNVKTAKALGLTVPATLLASADNVIE
ncbi:MAG: ABC transporter substrate-binding protein [Rhodopseudomonas sp.]|uniref:ABC transporter substrate-binding protein n=1 Tax=Rhodopseudomonas sp. TaxID=1078 RepID=UPI0018521570|nr:ABC transporter substrate-binding protein [Rhodopseudomonas sp.]NVN88720.1 ABC transporter substrate-binding protein [Rhodopseudomonas sp.]